MAARFNDMPSSPLIPFFLYTDINGLFCCNHAMIFDFMLETSAGTSQFFAYRDIVHVMSGPPMAISMAMNLQCGLLRSVFDTLPVVIAN